MAMDTSIRKRSLYSRQVSSAVAVSECVVFSNRLGGVRERTRHKKRPVPAHANTGLITTN